MAYIPRSTSGHSQANDPTAAKDIANKEYVDAVQAPGLVGTTITASTTVAINTFYVVNVTAAAATITLPAGPPNGSVVRFVRVDTSTFEVTISRGGGVDMIFDGGLAVQTYDLNMPGVVVTLTYLNAQWYMDTLGGYSDDLDSATSLPTANTLMRRDINARSQVANPSAAQDIATKNYVDTFRPNPTIQIYSTNGFYTYTPPAGLVAVKVRVVGPGGGGGAGDGGSGTRACGGGGGGGGYSEALILAANLNATEQITVGIGGAGGTGAGGDGSGGGTSAFGSHCSASGGAGGNGMTATTLQNAQGGTGGSGSGGDFNSNGQQGMQGLVLSSGVGCSGYGGSSYVCGGAANRIVANPGIAGTYGAGGSGGHATTTNKAGGAGGNGVVIIEEYY